MGKQEIADISTLQKSGHFYLVLTGNLLTGPQIDSRFNCLYCYEGQKILLSVGYILLLAEKAGFEPAVRYYRTHAFQACTFSHSVTSPFYVF